MSDLTEEWKKLRQEFDHFICKLDNATNRAIITDEQRKKVWDAAFESGWQNGRDDLWDRIDDYITIAADGTERHKLANCMGHTTFSDIVSVMSPDTFTERLTAYQNARKNKENQINPGDECYYRLLSCSDDGPGKRFIITKIYDGENGSGEKEKFFDAIFHDGRTISDGTLRLVTKTGNYYPSFRLLMNHQWRLRKMAKFEQPKMKVVKAGEKVPIRKIDAFDTDSYEPDWMISNREIVKINGEYIHLPPNHWNPYLSRVMRRNGKVYCNGRVWNAKRKKWQFSIKAYWYYIFDRRKING